MPLRPALALAALLLTPAGPSSAATAELPQRVAVINWGIAQTVLALGVEPVGLANVPGYRKWVANPPVPPGTADLGRRLEPDLGTLSGLAADLVLMSGHYPALGDRIGRIAPVQTHTLYASDGNPLERSLALARYLSQRLGRPRELAALQQRWQRALARLREQVATAGRPAVYVVQFRDAGHVRVFGRGSLYQGVLDRAGLANAWQRDTTMWGFSLVGITALDAAADLLLVVEPVPARARAMMRDSRLWRALPVTRNGRVRHLDPIWSFGSLPAATDFAVQLAAVLERG